MQLRARLELFRAEIVLRRANRGRRSRLEAELAAYATQAERSNGADESSSFTHSIYRGDRYRITTRLTLGPISG